MNSYSKYYVIVSNFDGIVHYSVAFDSLLSAKDQATEWSRGMFRGYIVEIKGVLAK